MPHVGSSWTSAPLPLRDLHLWDKNPRFPDEYSSKKDKELITFYLSDEALFGIRKLAHEIVAEFDLPQVEKIVVFKTKKKDIVLEGNRRVATYKLLADPELASTQTDKDFFAELKKRVGINDAFELEANITSDKEQGFKLMDRKHKKGNNEIGWGEIERRRDSVRRSKGSAQDMRRVELAKSVRLSKLPPSILGKVLGRGYVTTLLRILDSEPSQKKLGYKVRDDGSLIVTDSGRFNDLLKVIVYNVYSRRTLNSHKNNIDSRHLNSVDDIRNYLKKISRSDAKKVDKLIAKEQAGRAREKTKKEQKKRGSPILPSCFVIMPLSGLDEVYRRIQTAWKNVFGAKARAFNQIDDGNKGGKELIDSKILKNIRESTAVISMLSMGSKERKLFEKISAKERPKLFDKVFPFNVNVAVETGYAIRTVDGKINAVKDIFLIADRTDKKISASHFIKNHVFDLNHRDIIDYSEKDLGALEKVLTRSFKDFKKREKL